MDRRSTLLGLTGGVVSGPALTQNLQGWLGPFDKNTVEGQKNLSQAMGKLGFDEVESLKQAAKTLYNYKMRYGGGPNRKIAIALLHEISIAAQEKQAPKIQIELYRIMASLAHSIAGMSWHDGLESTAQNYFQLALRATHAGHDRLFGARILVGLAWQMYSLDKSQDGLNLIYLAQRGTRNIAGPQVKAMLSINEAWGYAALGQAIDFKKTIALSESFIGQIKIGDEPYWVSYNDEGELTGMAGSSLRLLATHQPSQYAEQASELKMKAIELRGGNAAYRYTAHDYIDLAETRFLLKDTSLAIDAVENALIIYSKLKNRCGATRRRLHDLYKYTNQTTKSQNLQALNQKLKSVLATV